MTNTAAGEGSGKRRAIASIASGLIVGSLTGAVASSFVMAATWSSIHGGMSGVTLIVVSIVGMFIPPASGVLAGWAVYRWWPQRLLLPADILRKRATRTTDSIWLTCPHCGCSMKRAAEYLATGGYTVVKCPIHGPFHFGPGTALTLGAPPQA